MNNHDVISLQEMVAHQQAELERLGDEFFAQQKEISTLKDKVAYLIEKLQGQNDDDDSGSALMENRPPPHY